jgi:osmotically-inducible protein OsmY
MSATGTGLLAVSQLCFLALAIPVPWAHTEGDGLTLTGAVPTYVESLDASDDAWSVRGVTAVDNELLVGLAGEAIVDADVAARCMAGLDSDPSVPHGAVTLGVVDGWVTLGGQVRYYFQRRAANDDVGRVSGVKGVTEDIEISGDPIPSDVADRTNKALARKAILSDSVIQVTNDGSTIYLDGTTDSWSAMQTAEETAWNAPGVVEVVDRIVLTS